MELLSITLYIFKIYLYLYISLDKLLLLLYKLIF